MEERWSGWDGAAPPPLEGNLVAACFTRNAPRLALGLCHARGLPEVALPKDRMSSHQSILGAMRSCAAIFTRIVGRTILTELRSLGDHLEVPHPGNI
jgi:hypothetical protein